MKQIIIPTDFSENAADALDYALQVYKDQKCNITIVHAITSDMIPLDNPAISATIITENMRHAKERMKVLEEFSNSFLDKNGLNTIDINTDVLAGGTAEVILRAAEEVEADLIIMGTNGESHNKIDKFLGTISTDIVKSADAPVLLVPRGYKYRGLKSILFATNLDHSDPYELWKTIKLLECEESIIRCLHVVSEGNGKKEDESRIEEFSKYMLTHSPSLQTIFYTEEDDNVDDTIVEYADRYNSDMIIMSHERKGFLRSILTHSHTKGVALKTDIPLLVVKSTS